MRVKARHLLAASAPWLVAACATAGWPTSSRVAVEPLGHPTVENREARLEGGASPGYTFYAFGDQRALADGEWQELMRHIGDLAAADHRSLFMIDTGDIVEDGYHSDQFHRLTEILSPAGDLPYLVGIGNHEKSDNSRPEAFENTAAFLGYLDDAFSPDRMFYRKVIGPVRFLFLDTSDFVYGDRGERKAASVTPGSRAAIQARWLIEELERDPPPNVRTTVAVMHHPIVQSSKKHSAVAATMWNLEIEGSALPQILADGGVDVILTGHTHTYERFRLTSPGGRQMAVVNVSGRPRNSFLWIGAGARRASDIAGREREWLEGRGWEIPPDWSIEQLDRLAGDEVNNFGIFKVDAEGGVTLEMAYLDEAAPDGLRREAAVRIR